MEMLLLNVDWVPVVVGAILAFGLGWLWYSDMLFGEKWRQGIGIPSTDNSPMMMAMIAQIVSTFLLSWVIGVTASLVSLQLAILVALTIAGIVKANGLFAQKSKYAISVEVGYILVMVVIMILTHAVL